MHNGTDDQGEALGVAIVAMAGRFPGAPNVERFWENVTRGVESVRTFTDGELEALGVDATLMRHPSFVKAGAVLDDVKGFDAALFGYSPREAELIDPQHRIFLECAWEALEEAGYASERPGSVGVFAGCGAPSYLLFNLLPHAHLLAPENVLLLLNGNDKDSLATRVAYKLNLTGPAVAVQSACSTSLVAVHMACQSLLTHQCDMAIAGGVSVMVPQRTGYVFQDGDIASRDGHCRAFDARAEGTVFGSGAGAVVMKRLEDASACGDDIIAVIRGSAVNNDGGEKVGYTAPGIDGQAEVVATALAVAGVPARSIAYVEAHGTGTALGDPAEIAALTRAFRATCDDSQFCAIGSVKTNVGHLDAAAGVVGLIKTALSLEQRVLAPSLHFERANPRIDFSNSPFYVNERLRPWPAENGCPRRAGVSSFGIGGTNAHVVLEEAPAAVAPAVELGAAGGEELVPLSARTGAALERLAQRLGEHLEGHPQLRLADVAHTLRLGRRSLPVRAHLVCRDAPSAIAALRALRPPAYEAPARSTVFMFPGQGSQYPDMARELYASQPVFRAELDACAEHLVPQLGRDLRDVLCGARVPDQATLVLAEHAQVALFATEYALARLWMHWGVVPSALLGHSVGEYTAACIAGVLSRADALDLLAVRARLMNEAPAGAMLAVGAEPSWIEPRLPPDLALAAINSPGQCVVAGPPASVDAFARDVLRVHGVGHHVLPVARAFHSALMDGITGGFQESVRGVRLSPPRIPVLSNLTGTWLRAEEATSPEYWARHLRGAVRFSDDLATVLEEPGRLLIEIGPGKALTDLALAHPACARGGALAISSLPHRLAAESTRRTLLDAAGQVWCAGVDIDWKRFADEAGCRRVKLPAYPFQHETYWIAPPARVGGGTAAVNEHAGCGPDAERAARAAPHGQSPGRRHARPSLETPYVAARDDLERGLAALWEDLLGIDSVGVQDSFFALGGDSLLAVRFAARVRELHGVDIDVRAVFETPTISQVAVALRGPTAEHTRRRTHPRVEEVLQRVSDLSEEEAEALLARELARSSSTEDT